MAFKGSNSFTTRTSIKNKTEKTDLYNKYSHGDDQGPDSDDMSSFFPCGIDDAIQYINLGCGARDPKMVILQCIFSSFELFLSFRSFF